SPSTRPSAIKPLHFDWAEVIPQRFAASSSAIHPILCLVSSYSLPGLPSPTNHFIFYPLPHCDDPNEGRPDRCFSRDALRALLSTSALVRLDLLCSIHRDILITNFVGSFRQILLRYKHRRDNIIRVTTHLH